MFEKEMQINVVVVVVVVVVAFALLNALQFGPPPDWGVGYN